MLSAYNEHILKAETVREYISNIKNIASISMQNSNENSARAVLQFFSMPHKRSYDYSLIIITLYGILESYIEQIIEDYLIALSVKIDKYSSLPEILIKSHLDLSIKLINNTSLKYDSITKEIIVSNLHSCLNQTNERYKLNTKAFTQHSANYRIDIIQEYFKLIGIENLKNSIKKSEYIIDFLSKEQGYSKEEMTTIPDTKYFEILEDLVCRRNIIAHGSEIDNLLSYDILDDYCKYIISLINSIYNIVLNNYYELMINKNVAYKLGNPIRVIDNRIICINSSNIHIKTGHVIIGINGNGKCVWGSIQSIKLNEEYLDEIMQDSTSDIGIGVLFKAKPNYCYYLLSNN